MHLEKNTQLLNKLFIPKGKSKQIGKKDLPVGGKHISFGDLLNEAFKSEKLGDKTANINFILKENKILHKDLLKNKDINKQKVNLSSQSQILYKLQNSSKEKITKLSKVSVNIQISKDEIVNIKNFQKEELIKKFNLINKVEKNKKSHKKINNVIQEFKPSNKKESNIKKKNPFVYEKLLENTERKIDIKKASTSKKITFISLKPVKENIVNKNVEENNKKRSKIVTFDVKKEKSKYILNSSKNTDVLNKNIKKIYLSKVITAKNLQDQSFISQDKKSKIENKLPIDNKNVKKSFIHKNVENEKNILKITDNFKIKIADKSQDNIEKNIFTKKSLKEQKKTKRIQNEINITGNNIYDNNVFHYKKQEKIKSSQVIPKAKYGFLDILKSSKRVEVFYFIKNINKNKSIAKYANEVDFKNKELQKENTLKKIFTLNMQEEKNVRDFNFINKNTKNKNSNVFLRNLKTELKGHEKKQYFIEKKQDNLENSVTQKIQENKNENFDVVNLNQQDLMKNKFTKTTTEPIVKNSNDQNTNNMQTVSNNDYKMDYSYSGGEKTYVTKNEGNESNQKFDQNIKRFVNMKINLDNLTLKASLINNRFNLTIITDNKNIHNMKNEFESIIAETGFKKYKLEVREKSEKSNKKESFREINVKV